MEKKDSKYPIIDEHVIDTSMQEKFDIMQEEKSMPGVMLKTIVKTNEVKRL